MFEQGFNKINLNNDLANAVTAKNLLKVKELLSLDDGPFIDYEFNGVPLILYAAQQKNWDIVEEFYNAGANLDVRIDYMDWYLVHECIKNAPERVTKAVIEYADLNCQTKTGKTPLMLAIEEKKINNANYILDQNKADLSILDKKGNNVAHYAAQANEYDLMLRLIENKVPLNQKNFEDKTPIDLIVDVSFRENLPKIIGQIEKVGNKKEYSNIVTDIEINEVVLEDKKEQPKKVSGLSSIKRK